MEKLKDWFLNKMLGRLAVRAGASLAMYLASGQLGITLSMDPNELAAAMITGANLLVSALKPRAKAPEAKPAEEAPKP